MFFCQGCRLVPSAALQAGIQFILGERNKEVTTKTARKLRENRPLLLGPLRSACRMSCQTLQEDSCLKVLQVLSEQCNGIDCLADNLIWEFQPATHPVLTNKSVTH